MELDFWIETCEGKGGGVGFGGSGSEITAGRRRLGGGGRLVISKVCGDSDEEVGDVVCIEPSWWSPTVDRIDKGGLLGRDKVLGGFAVKELELIRICICLLFGRVAGGGGERPTGEKS